MPNNRAGSTPGISEALSVLGPWLETRHYPRGRVLWTEGEVSGRLTVLDQGRVKILRGRPDGGTTLLFVMGPGEVFGFLPFLDGGAFPATAVALDDIEARVMSRERLREPSPGIRGCPWCCSSSWDAACGRRSRSSPGCPAAMPWAGSRRPW